MLKRVLDVEGSAWGVYIRKAGRKCRIVFFGSHRQSVRKILLRLHLNHPRSSAADVARLHSM